MRIATRAEYGAPSRAPVPHMFVICHFQRDHRCWQEEAQPVLRRVGAQGRLADSTLEKDEGDDGGEERQLQRFVKGTCDGARERARKMINNLGRLKHREHVCCMVLEFDRLGATRTDALTRRFEALLLQLDQALLLLAALPGQCLRA